MRTSVENKSFDHYKALLKKIDALCATLKDYYGREIICSPGCTSCCISRISLFPVETLFIKTHLDPSSINPQRDSASCIFLKEGACTVYRARPVLCRTQGFPLLYRGDRENTDTVELSLCERNLTGIEEISFEQVIDMDAVNLSLAAVNMRFLQDEGRYEEYKNRRIFMEDIAKIIWCPSFKIEFSF